MHEAFLKIKDFPNYLISNKGLVCRKKHTRLDKNGVQYLMPFKELKGTTCKDGYRKVHLTNKDTSKAVFIHRLVALHFYNYRDRVGKRTVNHIDGDKLNNHYTNLEWATDKENVDHAFKLGISSNKGTKNSQSKLTEIEVKKIIKLKGLMPQSLVAEHYGISKGHVSNIQRGHNWRWLNDSL